MRVGEISSYTVLKRKKVVDQAGTTVGKNLIDVVFSPDLKQMSHFVVGGGLIEELLEDIKLKEDVDPVFSAESIAEISKHIKLSVKKSDLKSVVGGGIPSGHHRFKDLSKMSVVDKNGANIGNIIDAAFFSEHDLSFIIGGGFLEETMERLGIIPDIDLIVPARIVSNVKDNKISLSMTQEELETTVQDSAINEKDLKSSHYKDFNNKVGLINRQSFK